MKKHARRQIGRAAQAQGFLHFSSLKTNKSFLRSWRYFVKISASSHEMDFILIHASRARIIYGATVLRGSSYVWIMRWHGTHSLATFTWKPNWAHAIKTHFFRTWWQQCGLVWYLHSGNYMHAEWRAYYFLWHWQSPCWFVAHTTQGFLYRNVKLKVAN